MRQDAQRIKEFSKIWETLYDLELDEETVFTATLYTNDGFVALNDLQVGIKYKNAGIASRLMQVVCDFADKWKLDVLVYPDDEDDAPDEVLVYFYGNYGFKMHDKPFYKGDFENYLLREPKG